MRNCFLEICSSNMAFEIVCLRQRAAHPVEEKDAAGYAEIHYKGDV